MPVFFQHQLDGNTRLGIWKIEETEDFFKKKVPEHRETTHPHKRLQHLAGRFLLQFLFPDFPYSLIRIAETRKPYLPDEQYHFSISHCGNFAAAIVSRNKRVGIDIEIPVEKIQRIKDKFLNEDEIKIFSKGVLTDNIQNSMINIQLLTLLWSAKESVFKWHGDGGVDFRKHIHLLQQNGADGTIDCFFSKSESELIIHYRLFDNLVLAWVLC